MTDTIIPAQTEADWLAAKVAEAKAKQRAADRARWAQDDADDAADRERRGLLGLPGGFVGR